MSIIFLFTEDSKKRNYLLLGFTWLCCHLLWPNGILVWVSQGLARIHYNCQNVKSPIASGLL